MKVTTTVVSTGEVIHLQVCSNAIRLNEVVAFCMTQPSGSIMKTSIMNNAHNLDFNVQDMDIRGLSSAINGPNPRKKSQ